MVVLQTLTKNNERLLVQTLPECSGTSAEKDYRGISSRGHLTILSRYVLDVPEAFLWRP